MKNQIYYMKHPTIKFESLSHTKVKYWEDRLSNISIDDIRLDRSNVFPDRHRILVNFGLDGHCPIFEEYFEIRGRRYEMLEFRMSQIPKKSSRYILDREPISYEVDDEILIKYGWDFTKEPR